VRYCTKCGAAQPRAPVDWFTVFFGVFLVVVASATAYRLWGPGLSSRPVAPTNSTSAASASGDLPTFDVQSSTGYLGESGRGLDITLTDSRPVSIQKLVINGRTNQPECFVSADNPGSNVLIGKLFGQLFNMHVGDRFTVMLNPGCGDKFVTVDIFTDHGAVEYRML
jgi:hypothetical protein